MKLQVYHANMTCAPKFTAGGGSGVIPPSGTEGVAAPTPVRNTDTVEPINAGFCSEFTVPSWFSAAVYPPERKTSGAAGATSTSMQFVGASPTTAHTWVLRFP